LSIISSTLFAVRLFSNIKSLVSNQLVFLIASLFVFVNLNLLSISFLATKLEAHCVLLDIHKSISGIFILPTVLTAVSNALLGIPITFSLKFLAIDIGFIFSLRNNFGSVIIFFFHFNHISNQNQAFASSCLNSFCLSTGSDSIHCFNHGV